jgi:hypothetical protein
VLFYPVSPSVVFDPVQLPGPQGAHRPALMVAVPVSALVWPVREGSGGSARSALVVGGAGKIESKELVAWCTVVAIAPAVVRRDGRVQADGRPCDHARLGALEQELDDRRGRG